MTAESSSHRIFLVSDGTGETASQMIQAAMVQFNDQNIVFTRYKNVRSEAQIEAICEDASSCQALMVFTLVSPTLRDFLKKTAWETSVACIDLMGPMLLGMAKFFGYQPKHIAGLLHSVDERYFERIDAMEYTIAHDDGRDLTKLDQADLVILGISRTSKTPLSMYLSHQGWKVANIPIIRGFQIPDELLKVDPRRVIALTINDEELARIRRARLNRLGQNNGGDYAELDRVHEEIQFAVEIYKKNRKWAVFDVTGKALEETASEIIRLMSARNLVPSKASE